MRKHPFIPTLVLLTLGILSGCNATPSDSGTTKTSAPANSETTKMITASELASARNSNGMCALDAIDEVPNGKAWTVKKSVVSTLRGWVATTSKQTPPQFILVLKAEQAYGFPGKTGVSRPDVAQALGSPELANSGYSFAADFSSLPPGIYHAQVLTNLASGAEICNFERDIIVTP